MVEVFTYKGQEFPLLYNHYAERKVLNDVAESKLRGQVVTPYEAEEFMVYYSIEAGCEFTDRPFTMKRKIDGKEIDVPLTKKDVSFMLGFIQEEIDEKLKKFFPDKADLPKDEDDAGKKKNP